MTDQTQPYTIVVGVSATSKSPTALHWATELAALRGGRVVAVRAWRPTPPQTTSRVTPSPITQDAPTARAQALAELEADVAEVLGGQHQVTVELVQGGRR